MCIQHGLLVTKRFKQKIPSIYKYIYSPLFEVAPDGKDISNLKILNCKIKGNILSFSGSMNQIVAIRLNKRRVFEDTDVELIKNVKMS